MYRLGIDLGGTNIAVGLVDENWKITMKTSIPTCLPQEPEALADRIGRFVIKTIEEAQIPMEEIESGGIGIPGTVIPENGMVEYANNLMFLHVPFLKMIQKYFPFPIAGANDAKAAAWGEYLAGAGRGASSMIMETLGTGIGGALIVDGKMIDGFQYGAGEIGHMVIQRNGRKCTCGRRGCFEAYASASALSEDGKKAAEEKPDSLLAAKCGGKPEMVDGKMIFEAAGEGDETAERVLADFIGYLAEGTANLINIFQPEIFCIGGGLSGAGETLLIPLREAVEPLIYSRESEKSTRIVCACLGNDAGIIGAALYQGVKE